jgi:hypothetical protein
MSCKHQRRASILKKYLTFAGVLLLIREVYVVFYNSLKDVRSIAPHMSQGSRAGQTWPTALNIPIRAIQTDIVFRCFCAPMAVLPPIAENLFSFSPIQPVAVRRHWNATEISAQEM